MTELVVPAFCYLPLCRSVDTWTYVLRPLPSEGHAFNTKARCPALMVFEVEEHREMKNDFDENSSSKNNRSSSNDVLDVATFLGSELQEYSEETIILVKNVKNPLSTTAAPLIAQTENPPIAPTVRLHSLFSKKLNESPTSTSITSSSSSVSTSSFTATFRRSQFWKPQGTGLLKLSAAEALAADIPKQYIENNHALKQIAKNVKNENEYKNDCEKISGNVVKIASSTSRGKINEK